MPYFNLSGVYRTSASMGVRGWQKTVKNGKTAGYAFFIPYGEN